MSILHRLVALAGVLLVSASLLLAQPPAPSSSPSPARMAAGGKLTVKATKLTGDISYHRGSGEWTEVTEGQELLSSDELHTGPESQTTLIFSDGSVLVVRELTQLMVGTLLSGKDKLKVELYLKLGDVKAQVQHRETVRMDFSIRTPTATASVRGTEIEHVSFHPPIGLETQLTSGQLLVDSSQGRVLTTAGDRSQVSPTGTLSTPQYLIQDGSRTHIEPTGLTPPEVQQINVTNQPQIITPQGGGGTATQVQTSNSGTLIFRVVLQ